MKSKVGEVRPTQLLHTYGVGSMIDLPHFAALVMGLDDWETVHAELVTEERLLRAVRTQLGAQVQELRLPPTEPDTQGPLAGPPIGVPVVPFPQWFRCPRCDHLAPRSSGLFDLKTDPYRPERARYVHVNCNSAIGAPPSVLPARFQVACERGHIDDFPWLRFVHQAATNCVGPLKLLKVGASDEAVDLLVKCESCGATRRMSDAFGDTAQQEPAFACRGRRPHLRDFEPGGCSEQAETILLGASNAWFAITLSALSIPSHFDALPQLVEDHWALLQLVTVREVIPAFRAAGNLKAFADHSDDEVWKAIEAKRRQESPPAEDADLKSPEWKVFSAADSNRNTRDFSLRTVAAPVGFEDRIDKVVLADRLREVRALTGFTRIDSPGDYSDPTEIPPELVAPIARGRLSWVPVSEVRGEGLFLQFREDRIRTWCKLAARRDAELHTAHAAWRRSRGIPSPDAGYPGLRYALIHSISHALIRQLAIESGYSAASIRERIYASDGDGPSGPMAGLLLYTAAPDSEGTLGGLVALGAPQKLGYLLRQSLESIRLCASDPLCAEHEPEASGHVTLHGAACHACLFAPETSCERGNKYLDRALLMRVMGSAHEPFFEPRALT